MGFYRRFSIPNVLMNDKTSRVPIHSVTISILKMNLTVITRLLLGSFIFGLTTLLGLSINGFYLGSYAASATLTNSLNKFILLILPHGVFEIPAIIIAGAAGFKIPYKMIRYLMGRKEQPLTREDVKEYLTLALISIILIVMAAFVEAYITPKIAECFLSKGI